MPKIRIKGFDSFLRGLTVGLEEFNERLKAEYKTAVEDFSNEVARAAIQNLQKPNWKLSEAIAASRLKIYDGAGKHTIFQAVEPKGSLRAKPNTPGSYAYYQEHGWVVDLKKVKRPNAARVIERNVKKGKRFRKQAAYRKQAGKKFFTRAAEMYLPALRGKINQIHETVRLEYTSNPEED